MGAFEIEYDLTRSSECLVLQLLWMQSNGRITKAATDTSIRQNWRFGAGFKGIAVN